MFRKTLYALSLLCLSLLALQIFVFAKNDNHKINFTSFQSIPLISDMLINHSSNPSYIKYNGKTVIDWNKPTDKYPDISKAKKEDIIVRVSLENQTVSIYNKNDLLSTFIVSTGLKGRDTPKGNFQIEPEKGDWFYNAKIGVEEGAKNWISFKDHGVYLFHSIVYDKNQQLIKSKQGKLGQKNSHGCVQMSVPDSKWMHDNLKSGMRVIVE